MLLKFGPKEKGQETVTVSITDDEAITLRNYLLKRFPLHGASQAALAVEEAKRNGRQ